jgi:hypothetical protein
VNIQYSSRLTSVATMGAAINRNMFVKIFFISSSYSK